MRDIHIKARCLAGAAMLAAAMSAQSASAECARMAPDPAFVRNMLQTTGEVERRVAFVLGNGNYPPEVGRLQNAVADATATASRLQSLGFQVYLSTDASAAQTLQCLEQAETSLAGAAIGLFYYAGHGGNDDETSFAIGIDARLDHIPAEGLIAINPIIDRFQALAKVNVFILDSCRSVPGISMASEVRSRGPGTRALREGLVRGAPREAGAEEDPEVMIVFATSPKRTATDGTGDHSPFTQALLKHLGDPGHGLDHVFADVAKSVGESTRWSQTPWTHSSMTAPIFLNGRWPIQELAATSAKLAAEARALSKRGKFGEAVKVALQGLPRNLTEKTLRTHFGAAHDALYETLRDRPVRTSLAGMVEAKLSPDGRHVAAAGLVVNLPGRRLALTDARTGSPIATIGRADPESSMVRDAGAIRCWSFSPDGSTLATLAGDGRLELWETASGRLVTGWPTHGSDPRVKDSEQGVGAGIAFSPTGDQILTVRNQATDRREDPSKAKNGILRSNEIRIWDRKSGSLLRTFSVEISRPPKAATERKELPNDAAGWETYGRSVMSEVLSEVHFKMQALIGPPRWSPDGRVLAAPIGTAGGTVDVFPQKLVVWSYPGGSRLPDLIGPTSHIQAFSLDRQGRRAAALSADSVAWVWEVATGKVLLKWPFESTGLGISMRPDGRWVAVQTSAGWSYLDVETGKPVATVAAEDKIVEPLLLSGTGEVLGTVALASDELLWRRGQIGIALLDQAQALLDDSARKFLEAGRLRYWTFE